ncbi:hypothetical protein C8J56DRAFT_1037519 [Mycena floridula]|nr:hypothetical protein C8J56DRAFT_1037519 [Mycena floridula]
MTSLIHTAENADYSFKNIPIIDLAELLEETGPAARLVLANQIRDACINVGFFYDSRFQNHGISEASVQEALSRSKELFSLPLESKMAIENKTTPNFMGYSSPLLSGNNDPNNNGDLQEGFESAGKTLGRRSRARPMPIASWLEEMFGQKSFPTSAALRCSTSSHAAVNLGKRLFPLFALPEDFFDDKTQHSAAPMRLLHYYPPQTGSQIFGSRLDQFG